MAQNRHLVSGLNPVTPRLASFPPNKIKALMAQNRHFKIGLSSVTLRLASVHSLKVNSCQKIHRLERLQIGLKCFLQNITLRTSLHHAAPLLTQLLELALASSIVHGTSGANQLFATTPLCLETFLICNLPRKMQIEVSVAKKLMHNLIFAANHRLQILTAVQFCRCRCLKITIQ